jgi:hypothetical protein
MEPKGREIMFARIMSCGDLYDSFSERRPAKERQDRA